MDQYWDATSRIYNFGYMLRSQLILPARYPNRNLITARGLVKLISSELIAPRWNLYRGCLAVLNADYFNPISRTLLGILQISNSTDHDLTLHLFLASPSSPNLSGFPYFYSFRKYCSYRPSTGWPLLNGHTFKVIARR